MGYFSLEILIYRHWRQEVPLSYCFEVSGGEIISSRELFANLYELKSRIGFWEEYSHFERIYKVCRLDRSSSNFAKKF